MKKLINCHIKQVNDKRHKGNVHGGKKKVFDYPFMYTVYVYIFEPLYYQMSFKCNCFIFILCIILLNAFLMQHTVGSSY